MSENYNETIAALLERVSVLERELAETRKLLAEKDAVIAAQSARIKELEERLGKNSQTVPNLSPRMGIASRVRSATGKRRDGKRDIRDTDSTCPNRMSLRMWRICRKNARAVRILEPVRRWRHLLSAMKLTWTLR